jgi:outer membrane translocation and assembly module TamA
VIALIVDMKLTHLIALVLAIMLACLLVLVLPGQALACGQEPEPNVNARYDVEAVIVTGVSESRLSQTLRDDMQQMVGAKFSQETADALAARMRKELKEYRVTVKVSRGKEPERVQVEFEAHRKESNGTLALSQLIYHSYDGFSGAITLGLETHHNVFAAGLVNSADELLERNAGYSFRYEHRRVGTDALQVKIEFAKYHQTFDDATKTAAASSPGAPDIYGRRQSLEPAVSVIPYRGLTLSAGLSFQDLDVDLPAPHTVRAYAATAGIQFNRRFHAASGFTHAVAAGYDLRSATGELDSDLVYTRHLVSADYTLSVGRHLFGVHARGGHIDGDAPFFERFSLGSAVQLRGWDKFDVAPLGGARLIYGSLEYRYRPVRIFYDVGSVWDRDQSPLTRHALGFGLVSKEGFFLSVGFPVRLHEVKPAVMFGFRRELP